MSVVEDLVRLGGVATRAGLLELAPRREVDAALRAGTIVRLTRGRYALPGTSSALTEAHRLTGVLCLASAALHWGWAVKTVPARPQVSVAKNRKIAADRLRAVDLHRQTLHDDDVVDGVTSRERTLLDCLRRLPFDEALSIADSALRDGLSRAMLTAIARDARGPGSTRVRRIASLATPEAANPFESALRALALRVRGISVRPQVALRENGLFLGRPDLVDEALAIVLEADSFEWHGERAALRADARRYNALAARGWLVLRFSWEDVMFEPDLVIATIRCAVAERTQSARPTHRYVS